ncbi:MAG TPA: DUF2232 domain-containing protein [Candidatus Sulfotelmatobacter sp.]|nr:DUF2232 domain-containing protein [Candidatus Sulfotelmatobacter sp.]
MRALLLVALLGAGLLLTQLPWAILWLAVPFTVALALLMAWRFGAWTLLLPPALGAGLALSLGVGESWTWWIPAAALSGVWMGLREERGAPSGTRAWMLLPVLVLAAATPWMPGYADRVARLDQKLAEGDAQMIDTARKMGLSHERLDSLRRTVEQNAPTRKTLLPNILPSLVFAWIALLVVAGRTLGSRLGEWLRWPALDRLRLREWRLPDGAIWTFLAGLALLVAQWPAWGPTAWTLLLNSGLGFCVQGIAVVESLMLARGVPPSLIALTLLVVCVFALPVFMFTTAVLGLSDFWLDYRRMESSPNGDVD